MPNVISIKKSYIVKRCISALKYIGIENTTYSLLRMDFDDALLLFEDNYFDFIYVDGFAHTGEEGGKTLIDWIKKLKVGGYLAGDDYHNDWPLVVWAVNDLAKKLSRIKFFRFYFFEKERLHLSQQE